MKATHSQIFCRITRRSCITLRRALPIQIALIRRTCQHLILPEDLSKYPLERMTICLGHGRSEDFKVLGKKPSMVFKADD